MTDEEKDAIGGLLRDAAMLFANVGGLLQNLEKVPEFEADARLFYERVKTAFPAK